MGEEHQPAQAIPTSPPFLLLTTTVNAKRRRGGDRASKEDWSTPRKTGNTEPARKMA